MNNQDNNIFWLEKPIILLNTFDKFIPTKNMTTIQQMNSITLFCIYALILLKVVDLDNKLTTSLFIGIIIILILIYINRYKHFDTKSNVKSGLKSGLKSILKKSDKMTDNVDNVIDVDNTIDATHIDYGKKSKKVNFVKDISIESGYYDSDDVLRISNFRSEKNRDNVLDNMVGQTSLDNQHLLNQNRELTDETPCINPLLNDFNTDNCPTAANMDDNEMNDRINLTYRKNLFYDGTTAFDHHNTERLFYNTPGGAIPNDQHKFAQWLYGGMKTGKQDSRYVRMPDTFGPRYHYPVS